MSPTEPKTPPAEPPSVPSPPLAYLDPAFVNGDDGRALRILAEYLQTLERFREAGVQDTVVFFGSARIVPEGPLKRRDGSRGGALRARERRRPWCQDGGSWPGPAI